MQLKHRLLSVCLFATLAAGALPAWAAPTIAKDSILIATRRHTVFIKSGKRDEKQWSWTPRIQFQVNGPIESGTAFYVDFMVAGKAWVTIEMGTVNEAIAAGGWWSFNLYDGNLDDDKGILHTGDVDFKIRAKNELKGNDDVVYKGKFKVAKMRAYPDNNLPQYKNVYEQFVDQDWNLPIAYAYTKTTERQYGRDVPGDPYLQLNIWTKGNDNGWTAFIFYKDQQVKESSTAGGSSNMSISTGETSGNNWYRGKFHFPNIRPKEISNHPDCWWLNKNPGTYTVKLLKDGKLSRVGTFEIDANGEPTDKGLAKKNGMGEDGKIIFGMKILGDKDGKVDGKAWKTGAFYGNPLQGFTAP